MLQTNGSTADIISAPAVKTEASLRSVARGCLDDAKWNFEEATKLFVEQVAANPELTVAAVTMAFHALRSSIGSDARSRVVSEMTRPGLDHPNPPKARYADKVSSRVSLPASHSERPDSPASMKPVTPFARQRSQSWSTPKDPLQEFQILHIPIRDVTADMLRRDISMRNSRAATDTKFAKFETDLLKHMRPNKTVGKSMSDTAILDLIRKHKL